MMGKTDTRVRVPGTSIRLKGHRELAAVARYLNDVGEADINTILDNATLRNGRLLRTWSKGVQSLGNRMKAHPHFDNIPRQPQGQRERNYWFLCNPTSYLLGPGQAYPPEFYDDPYQMGLKKKE